MGGKKEEKTGQFRKIYTNLYIDTTKKWILSCHVGGKNKNKSWMAAFFLVWHHFDISEDSLTVKYSESGLTSKTKSVILILKSIINNKYLLIFFTNFQFHKQLPDFILKMYFHFHPFGYVVTFNTRFNLLNSPKIKEKISIVYEYWCLSWIIREFEIYKTKFLFPIPRFILWKC